MTLYRAARAIFLALSVGDALGLPLEISGTPPHNKWLEDPKGVTPVRIGDRIAYSDDTELTLILARSIVDSCGFNPVVFVKRLAEEARTWDPIRNYGLGVAEVVEAVRRGRDWRVAARLAWGGQGSFGNGGAVRVPPIPIFYTTRDAVEAMAVAQAMVTHTHPLGVEGARLHALALYELMHGMDVEELPYYLARETMYEEFRERLELIQELIDASPERVAKVIGNGSAAFESIPAAVYVLVRARGDPVRSIAYALSLGGDTDSIAALASSLAAAANPDLVLNNPFMTRMFQMLEDNEVILETADSTVEASIRCHETPF
ncbi:Poly(ADP-ribose) glycohydrolase [Pyrolobus fumarii 1A]|uniref:Poly(ADP-ribose) glycohydrolase n=1 Tax=Pyrolobus fumarii (strain DSM 11204 / 1A) TaxID=694429 RepID=G0EC65_PYRF1|nr:ADP-ribosylglycohydrolase family protein [Pyrolobus fumarii]AEM39435.1 Poly(ADP-ribose) glycohydrolase [Pyrolobus fumarii 1A]